MSCVHRGEKTDHHDGQRSKAGSELDPWSPVLFEPLIPFRDFRQETLPAWSTRHGCSYSVRWSRAKRRVIGKAGLEKIQLARLV